MKNKILSLFMLCILMLFFPACSQAKPQGTFGETEHFTYELTGNTATIKNKNGAEVTITHVTKIEKDDDSFTVHATLPAGYRAKAKTFAVTSENFDNFNVLTDAKYQLYIPNEWDLTDTEIREETMSAMEMIGAQYLSLFGTVKENIRWELLPIDKSGNLPKFADRYTVYLDGAVPFAEGSGWEDERNSPTFKLQLHQDPNQSNYPEDFSIATVYEANGEGRWIYFPDGPTWFMQPDGSFAEGWRVIDGQLYRFTKNSDVSESYLYFGGQYKTYDLVPFGTLYDWLLEKERDSIPIDQAKLEELIGQKEYIHQTNLPAGWVKGDDGKWRYRNGKGGFHSGWLYYEDDWYYFNGRSSNYTMVTGWLQLGRNISETGWDWQDVWYYLDPETGKLQTGWLNRDGNQYYFTPDGNPYTGWLQYEGDWYYFDPDNCTMQTGWLSEYAFYGPMGFTQWYYLDPDTGKRLTGPQYINGHWHYFDEETGVMLADEVPEGYYASEGDKALTGWVDEDTVEYAEWRYEEILYGSKAFYKWYCFDSETGEQLTGGKSINGLWRYFDEKTGILWMNELPDGLYTNLPTIEKPGWLKAGSNTWYYIDFGTWEPATGWLYDEGDWYYLDPDTGAMWTNTYTPDGYYVNESGRRVS